MQPQENQLVLYSVESRVAWLTLNRPEKRNALSADMVTALKHTLTRATEDADVRVVVIQAAGNVFCSGADLDALRQMQSNTYDQNLADSEHLRELFLQIASCPKPVVAAVQGSALAGGCGLVSVADFSLAVPEAQFGYTEVRIGFIPALVSAFLVKRIGEARARVLLLSGDLIPAEEAQKLGLITRVVPAYLLHDEVKAFAERLAGQNSGEAMAHTKALLMQIDGMSVVEATALAARENATARASHDCKRGINAFLNKEKISW